ncbi:MAG TPA: histidine kinase [Bacteroidota bacterium]|nr:histidine kinase [Bacteroidota bacterium]
MDILLPIFLEPDMTPEQKNETGGYILGVILTFALKTTIESLLSDIRPQLSAPSYIAFNLGLSLGVNFVLVLVTRRMNAQLERLLPWHSTPVRRFVIQGLVTMVLSLATAYLLVALPMELVLPSPTPSDIMERRMYLSTLIAFTLSTLYTGVYFLNQWGGSRAQVERLKQERLKAQFAALKQQLNPHFLFNSLSTLSSLLAEDPEQASQFVQKLSSVYRYVLEVTDLNVVDLRREVQALEAYAYLQQVRFGNSLQLKIVIPEESTSLFVAPLTLQILLENAIKHNVISSDKPLQVDIDVEGDNWLVLKNRIQKKYSVETGTGIGLKNIVNRYRLLDKRVVEIKETSSEFIVRIPLLNRETI